MPPSAAQLTLLDLDDALIAHTLSLLEPRTLGVLSCVDSRLRSLHVDGRAADGDYPNAVDTRAARLGLTLSEVSGGAPRAQWLLYAEEPAQAWQRSEVTAKIDAWVDCRGGLSLHPDGDRLAAIRPAGERRAVGVWSVSSGEQQCCLQGHRNEVLCVALDSLGGDTLVSGAEGGELLVWSLRTAALLGRLSGHSRQLWTVAVRGTVALSGGFDRTVKVWNLDKLTCVRTQRMEGEVKCVAFAGDEALGGGYSNKLKSWSLACGTARLVMEHPHWVSAVSVEGHVAATGCVDGIVRTWSLVDGTCTRKLLRAHMGAVISVALRGGVLVSGGSDVLSGDKDHTAKVWALDDGRCVATLDARGDLKMAIGDGFIVDGSDFGVRVRRPRA